MGSVKENLPPIGTLTDRVQFKRHEPEAAVHVPVCSMWARVRTLIDGAEDGATHAVVLRFRNDIKPGDRIIYRGRNLDVVSAADLNGRKSYLSIRAIAAQEKGEGE